jgi:hypothetical protein
MEELFTLIAQHNWVAIAALVIGFLVRLLKSDTKLPITLPAGVRPWLALVFGAGAGVLEHVMSGMSWGEALTGGLVAALTAIAGHDTLVEGLRGGREVPLPGLTRKQDGPTITRTNATMLVLCAALVLSGCALFRNVSSYLTALEDEYGEEFAQMVEIICGRAEAKARRMDDVQEAQQLFCFAEHQLSPYVPIALDAMQRGESRAARAVERGDR